MALFTGRTENKVDRKGRVSVPAPFRASLAAQSFAGIVVSPHYELNCIEGCGYDRLLTLSESLDDPDAYPEADRERLALVFAESTTLGFDEGGRVLLPQELTDLAGIEERALFVGLGTHFQIWEPERFAAHRRRVLDQGGSGRPISLGSLRPPRRPKEAS